MKQDNRMKKIASLIIIVPLFLCVSSSGCTRVAPAPYKFSLPEIPSFITDSGAKKSYMGMHFWDNYDFKDTTFIRSDAGHKIFWSYLYLLSQLPVDESAEDIGAVMEKARADSTVCMEIFTGAEQILYSPNSELRNETLYIEVLKKILSWSRLNESYKIRPRFQYKLALRNRPGEPTTDFTYTLASGRNEKLYGLRSDYVLLLFYDPECTDCKRVKKLIEKSETIDKLISGMHIKVLSVYPDKDLRKWKESKGTIPSSWIAAYDKGTVIKLKNLYDIRATPTMYLLDKDKRVLLKDATFEQIEQYLKHTTF
jgi:hypothetical protein